MAGEAVVKLAPGLPHDWIPLGVEAEWVSLDGQLREAVLWSGRAVDCERRATVLRQQDDHVSHAQLTDADDPGTAEVKPVGRYVYEPDDAVIRAHLVTAFAAAYDGWLLDPHLAYVSADSVAATGLGEAYELIDVLPFKEKALRAALRVPRRRDADDQEARGRRHPGGAASATAVARERRPRRSS